MRAHPSIHECYTILLEQTCTRARTHTCSKCIFLSIHLTTHTYPLSLSCSPQSQSFPTGPFLAHAQLEVLRISLWAGRRHQSLVHGEQAKDSQEWHWGLAPCTLRGLEQWPLLRLLLGLGAGLGDDPTCDLLPLLWMWVPSLLVLCFLSRPACGT